MRIVVLAAAAEPVPEVLVVLVALRRLLSGHTSFLASRGVHAQGAWCGFGEARGSAVADEVALVEELDEGVFAVAGDGAGVADGGGDIWIGGVDRRRIAIQT